MLFYLRHMNATQSNSAQPSAIVLNLGTELAQGFVANTNAHWLADSLRRNAFRLLLQATLPDDEAVFLQQFHAALTMSPDLLLLTGGLGPTDDDMTRQLVSQALGLALEYSPEAEQQIRTYFSSRNWTWSDANRVQAYLPLGAQILRNPCGTAPGFLIRHHGTSIVCLPGVPFEMRRMFADFMNTHRNEFLQAPPLMHIDALYAGIGEATLGSQLRACNLPQGVSWCSLPNPEGILIRLYQQSQDQSSLRRALHSLLESQGDAGRSALVCTDGSGLVRTLLHLLAQGKQTISSAESCTGGMIGELITAVPGSSEVYLGGVITYANAVKESMLEIPPATIVDHGAVSEAVVSLMADNVRKRLGSTWGIATSGIAGPSGGSPEKPVGTVWTAISGPNGIQTFCEVFPGDRDEIRIRSVYRLLNALRTSVISVQNITCSFEQ